MKIKGQWAYLSRVVDKGGDTIDFYLSTLRNTKAARRFLGNALHGLKECERPLKINTGKAPTYGPAILQFKKEGKLPEETVHRQVKYLNNVIESDHGRLTQMISGGCMPLDRKSRLRATRSSALDAPWRPPGQT